MSEHDAKLHETLGYIRGTVEAIEKKVDKQNGAIVAMGKRVQKTEVALGKIGSTIAALTFGVTIFINLGVAWIKSKFFS